MAIDTNTPKSHGGYRPGAGRKKNAEPTVRLSVPASTKSSVIDFVKKLSDRKASEGIWPDSLIPVHLAENPPSFRIPLFSHPVQAGFPSPADDYVADKLDLNEHLIARKEATFMVRVMGDSMVGVGIQNGDLLIVDKSIKPSHGDVVVANVDGEFTVKTLEKTRGRLRLIPANSNFEPIEFKEGQELQVWGVVTSVIHQFKP
jgi:DNA polymerase V